MNTPFRSGRGSGALAAAVALRGCGGGDGDAAGDTATGGSDSTSEGSVEQEDDESVEQEDDEEASLSSAECTSVLGAFAAPVAALTGADDLELEVLADALVEAAERVPSEIQRDLLLLADALSDMATAFNDLDIDFSDPSSRRASSRHRVPPCGAADTPRH